MIRNLPPGMIKYVVSLSFVVSWYTSSGIFLSTKLRKSRVACMKSKISEAQVLQ